MQNSNAGIGNYSRVYQYVNYSKLYPVRNDALTDKSNESFKFVPQSTRNKEWIA